MQHCANYGYSKYSKCSWFAAIVKYGSMFFTMSVGH